MPNTVNRTVRRGVCAAGAVLLATALVTCTPAPAWRTVHVRIIDLVRGADAPIPLGTAHLPRDTIAGDTRPVLIPANEAGRATVEHARVTLDIPSDAQLELAYGARGRGRGALPPDAQSQFIVDLITASGTQRLLEDTPQTQANAPLAWKSASLALPEAKSATLVFSTRVPDALRGAVLPQFAAPIVTVPTRKPRPRSVVLISLDTLRADHLGIYGYAGRTSANMDMIFGTAGVVVGRTYSQAANTPGGHVAMLKGVWPTTAFKSDGKRFWHSAGILSLAEVLRGQGYRTAAFTEDALLDGPAGFNRGFDDAYYEELQTQGEAKGHIEKTFDRGLDWLSRHRDEPVFLFLHTYQVHHPYTPPPEYAARFPIPADAPPPQRDRSLYDAEIAYTDEQMGRLVRALDELGRRDDTILVVTSDHGEEFGEHGRRQHGSNVTDEILHVPLLLRAPGLLPSAVRRDGPMALMDLPPTLLDLLNLPVPDCMHGRSLAKHVRDGEPVGEALIYSEAAGALAETYGGLDWWYPPSYAVTRWPWRMARIRTDQGTGVRYTLYDLERDPGETKNLFDQRGVDLEVLRSAVDLYEPTAQAQQLAVEARLSRGTTGTNTVPEQDPAREEKMRALGYVP